MIHQLVSTPKKQSHPHGFQNEHINFMQPKNNEHHAHHFFQKPYDIHHKHGSDHSPLNSKKRSIDEPFVAEKKICLSASKPTEPKSAAKLLQSPGKCTTLQDRFIPNRAMVDIDYNYYALHKTETIEETEMRFTPGQRKMKQELTALKGTENKRMIDCRSLTPAFDRVSSFQDHMKVRNILKLT